MTEVDIEQIIRRARERFPGITPRVISGNGPQFAAKDFKGFIRLGGITHVKTSPTTPEQRQDRALPPDHQRRLHPHRDPAVPGVRHADVYARRPFHGDHNSPG